MFQSKELARLQEQLATAEAQNASLTEANAALTAERDASAQTVATLTAERDAARADLATAQERITQIETDHTAEVARINGEVEQRIQTEVTNRCAAAGVEPIARDPEAGSKADDTKGAPAAGLSGIAKARALLSEKHKALYGGKN
jgi:chromosome segregation ATPase